LNHPSDLLTVREFARRCSLTEGYVRQLLQEGRLRRLKLGDPDVKQGRIRIPASEIERIFTDTTVQPKSADPEPTPDEIAIRALAIERAMNPRRTAAELGLAMPKYSKRKSIPPEVNATKDTAAETSGQYNNKPVL